ncbi:hypothetical protein Vafri_17270 [Volvox africanus]|uniref:Uncharacterized protein n=1 Tax=Volvox africanus TaxID=51714 RepID=A0A8J4F6H6_9CHLO|nr:hypothetical protein Vafri_17270 [Volvox africanus]
MIPQPDQQEIASQEEEISLDILLPEDLVDFPDVTGVDGILSDSPTSWMLGSAGCCINLNSVTSNPRESPDAAACPNNTHWCNMATTATCDGASTAAQQRPDALGDLLNSDLDSDTIGFGHHQHNGALGGALHPTADECGPSTYHQPSPPRECLPHAYFPLPPTHESAASCSPLSTTATLPPQAQQQEQRLEQLRWQQSAATPPNDHHLLAPRLVMPPPQQHTLPVPPPPNPAFGNVIRRPQLKCGLLLSRKQCRRWRAARVHLLNDGAGNSVSCLRGTAREQHGDVLHLSPQLSQQSMQQWQSSPFKPPQPPQQQQLLLQHVQQGPSTSTSYIYTTGVPLLPAMQGLQFPPWTPFKAAAREFNSMSGDIGGGTFASGSVVPPCIDDILERWWRELGGVSNLEHGKVVWKQQQQQQELGERQHEELCFISEKCCWARCQIQFPSSLVDQLWPNDAGAASTAPKGPGGGGRGRITQGAHSSLKCQTLQFVGPSELRSFGGKQGISSNSGSKQRFARQLKQVTGTQQQRQERQEQGGGGTTDGLYVIDKYTYTCSGKPNPSPPVEKVMLAFYDGDANIEDLKASNASNVRLKGQTICRDEWHSGIFEVKESTRSSYVRLKWRAWWPAVYTVKAPCGRSKAVTATAAAAAGTSAAAAFAGPSPSISGPSWQVVTCMSSVSGSSSTAALVGHESHASPPQSMSQRGFVPPITRPLPSPPPQPCANVPEQSAPLQYVQGQHTQHQHRQGFGHGLSQLPIHGHVGPGAASMLMLPHGSVVSEQWGQQYPFPFSTRWSDEQATGPKLGLGPIPSSQDMRTGSIAAAYYPMALPAPQEVRFPGPGPGSVGLPVEAGLDFAEQARCDQPMYTLPQQVQALLQPTVHLQQQQPFYQALPNNNTPEVAYMRPPDSRQFTGRLDGDGASTSAGIWICTAAAESGYPADASSTGIGAAIVNPATASYVAPLPPQTAAYGHSSEHNPPQQGISRAAAENAGGMAHVDLSEGLGSFYKDLITGIDNDVPGLASGRSVPASCTIAPGPLPGGDDRPVGAGLEAAPFNSLPSDQQNTCHHQNDQQEDLCASLHKAWQDEGQTYALPLVESTAGTTTAPRSMLKKRRESNGSSSSDGGGASSSKSAARSDAACPPRECEAKNHVKAMEMFLEVFLEVFLKFDIDCTNVLRTVLKNLGTVRNMLQLRDCHDEGYGLFNMMLHAAINVGAEGGPGGAAPRGSSTGVVSSGSGSRSSSLGLEQRLIQAFEVVLERLDEPGTDMPPEKARKMLLVQQDRECHDTPNHTCASLQVWKHGCGGGVPTEGGATWPVWRTRKPQWTAVAAHAAVCHADPFV